MQTAIVVDDEPNLVSYLVSKLGILWPELEISGTANNGIHAIALAQSLKPDIVFLDIQMPGLNGFQVAEKFPIGTKIVFVTAFNQYAVEAFNESAVDYLLKPVTDERLTKTIQKLKQQAPVVRDDLVALVKTLLPEKTPMLEWLRVGIDDITELVQLKDVIYFKADLKYIDVVTLNKTYLIRQSLVELERLLDPNQFWRINRGCIVRVDQITQAKRDFRGRYEVSLRDHKKILLGSQTYSYLFKKS